MTKTDLEAAINRYASALDRERAVAEAELEAIVWHSGRELATMRALVMGEMLDAPVLAQLLSMGAYLKAKPRAVNAQQETHVARMAVLEAFAAYRPESPEGER